MRGSEGVHIAFQEFIAKPCAWFRYDSPMQAGFLHPSVCECAVRLILWFRGVA